MYFIANRNMPMPQDVETFLTTHKIQYVLHEHPAVFTCEEAEKYCGNIPGMACKNLFLRAPEEGRYFLLVLHAKKRCDFKKCAETSGTKKVTFADEKKLEIFLGLTPGAVTPFGLLNDSQKRVELFVDKEVWDAPIVSFHPNVNTATLELTSDMFHRCIEAMGHSAIVVEM